MKIHLYKNMSILSEQFNQKQKKTTFFLFRMEYTQYKAGNGK